MAEVFVATRPGPHGFNKRFAVKRILPELARDARFVAMFCDEARICAGLSHPNIVQVVDFGESDGEVFMALEYVDGVSLARLLRAVAAARRRFPVPVALFIAHEVLRALDFAHSAYDEQGRSLGIVHRDVSPGNVLIGRAGEVKLGDFGILLSAFVDRRTYPGELKGKVGYMSPEQAMGGAVDRRSDLFALGIVLAEMLLARPLFSGQKRVRDPDEDSPGRHQEPRQVRPRHPERSARPRAHGARARSGAPLSERGGIRARDPERQRTARPAHRPGRARVVARGRRRAPLAQRDDGRSARGRLLCRASERRKTGKQSRGRDGAAGAAR